MKSKKLSEKILRSIKSKGFKSINLNPVLEAKYILQRSGESFKKFLFSFFDLNGKAVEPLIQNRMMQAGRYQIEWDGRQHASGMYLYSIQAGEFRQTKKMVLLK